jgi:hypothetical protein
VFGYDLRSKRHFVGPFVGPKTTHNYLRPVIQIFPILGLHMPVLPCTLKQ